MINGDNALKTYIDDIATGKGTFEEADFDTIRELVRLHNNKHWNEKELTFAILTSIGFPTSGLQTDKLSDLSIPYASEHLQQALQDNPALLPKFLDRQERILTGYQFATTSSETSHKHHNILDSSQIFEYKGLLYDSQDNNRKVDQVICIKTQEKFARKLLCKTHTTVEEVKNEIDIMRQIDHDHVVKLVASYTDRHDFGLIIHPVADGNLRSFLVDTTHLPGSGRGTWIRTFFGCLVHALQHLHASEIHHRDIKPENILVRENTGRYTVMFCDFGISKNLAGAAQHTTYDKQWGTIRYCAPELRKEGEGHNEKMDIFSMACVFVEMWTVIHKKKWSDMDNFMTKEGGRSWTYHECLNGVRDWTNKIRLDEEGSCEIEPIKWIDMGVSALLFDQLRSPFRQLHEAYRKRPSAAQLLSQIRDFYYRSTSTVLNQYIGECCVATTTPSISSRCVYALRMKFSIP